MTKKELRKKYLQERKKMSEMEIRTLSEQIFDNFQSEFPVIAGQKIHVFMTISKLNEIETDAFIEHFWTNGAQVFVPKMIDNQLIAVEYNRETKMETNSWGISEPSSNVDSGIKDFDYIITPLLYCDNTGNRVGYGKGYYDRFFSGISETCLKVGLSFFQPQEIIEDVSDWDTRLDHLVTPETILSFRGF